jgi:hypothetical protein
MCALYTKGVSFGNVQTLSNISLYEMDYRRFGAKVGGLVQYGLAIRLPLLLARRQNTPIA